MTGAGGRGRGKGRFQHKYSNFISLQVGKLRCFLYSFIEFPSRIKSQLPITESCLIMHHLLALSLCLISYYQCFLLSPPKQITYPHILVSNSAYGGNPIVVIVVSVMSDSLWPHELLHARPLWPPPLPRVCANSCPLSKLVMLSTSSSATTLPSIFPTLNEVFSNELTLHIRWPKYWSLGFSNLQFRVDFL